ncbi:MAG: hypothetical protein ACOYBD_00845 [Bilifractor sp.]|jgi:hypothetical protein
MKEKRSYRKLMAKASALVLSAFMLTAAAPPVWADGTQENTVVSASAGNTTVKSNTETDASTDSNTENGTFTITFKDVNGNVLEEFTASKHDTWGPSGDISVRSTFYKNGKDYDIVSGPNGTSLNAASDSMQVSYKAPVTGNMVFTYQEHTGTATSDKTYKCMTEDGTLLYIFTGSEDKIPETLAPGSKLYTRSSTKNDSADESVVNVYYTLTKDTDTRYPVTVNYVNEEDGSTITSRTFYVNDKKHTFEAPRAFSVTENGKTVNYKAVDNTSITHEISDTARTYTIRYKKVTADSGEKYSWYVLLYNSETNRCIDSKVIDIKPGEEGTFTPDKTITVNGSTYTINKAFDKQFTHSYDDSNHTIYVYYDPEGYSNSSEIQTRDINIQYVNIANGNVIQSRTQTVTSEGDTRIDFPDSLDIDGIHYLRVAGQVAYVDHNFYSPKETYTVYYYDENNTAFQKVVITREEVQEVTVTDGGTTYRVIPGITRTVMLNTDTGVSTVLSTNDSTGAAIAPVAPGSVSNGTGDTGNGTEANAENGNEASSEASSDANAGTDNNTAGTGNDSGDVSIDGVQADEIQTPESNIKLNSDKDKNSTRNLVIMVVSLAALAVCAVIAVLLVRRRKALKH